MLNLKNNSFIASQVGYAIAPNEAVVARPHCHLYTDDDGNVASMMIICGGGLNFIFNEMQHPSDVFIKLMATSYVLDLTFPAHYGLLWALEELCIIRPKLENEPGSKRPKVTPPSCFVKFLESFETFLAENNDEA